MLHAYTWNWIHLVWGTKNRERLLFKEIGIKLYSFFETKSNEMNVSIERLNIQPEHIHLLINLPANICLSDYVRRMKGSSSRWLNENKFLNLKFEWQRGYGAFSVSQSQLKRIKNYISHQSEHHKNNSFEGEYETWREKYYKEAGS